MKPMLPSGISLVGALTAWQEQAEFWLRVGASAVAIVSGALAIAIALRHLRHKPPPDSK